MYTNVEIRIGKPRPKRVLIVLDRQTSCTADVILDPLLILLHVPIGKGAYER